jgi:hypothetical protein
MKIVVMSDTHLYSPDEEFKAICSQYCRDADLTIHLGDYASGSVLDFLERFPLEAVAGNTDDANICSRLPAKKVIQVGNWRFGLTHGCGWGANIRPALLKQFADVDAILFGHTHQPLQIKDGNVFWFNPGSVSSGRGGSSRSLGILYVGDRIESEIMTL